MRDRSQVHFGLDPISCQIYISRHPKGNAEQAAWSSGGGSRLEIKTRALSACRPVIKTRKMTGNITKRGSKNPSRAQEKEAVRDPISHQFKEVGM